MLPKIENPSITRVLEHTSINGPPFPTTSKSRIRYFFSQGRLISTTGKRGALWVPWLLAQHPYSKGPGRSKPIGQVQVPLPTGQAQVSSHEHGSEPRPKSRLVDYPTTAKAYEIYYPDTSSPSWLSSLRRFSANNFPTDPSQLENTSSHK